jgi:hypothetical protein
MSIEHTEAELAELKARPINASSRTVYTPEQLAIRRAIGKKCTDYVMAHDDLTDEQKAIYAAYPCYLFYRKPQSGLRQRVYGVAMRDSDAETTPNIVDGYDRSRWILHTATAQIMFTNKTVGGTPATELEPTEWTDEDIRYFEFNPTPGIFLDPLGFLCLGT